MTSVDSYARSRQQNAIAESVRKFAAGEARRLGLDPEKPEVQTIIAEALANAGWSREGATDDEIREAVVAECRSLDVPARELSAIETERIRAGLRDLARRWQALLPKGSLSVTFPP